MHWLFGSPPVARVTPLRVRTSHCEPAVGAACEFHTLVPPARRRRSGAARAGLGCRHAGGAAGPGRRLCAHLGSPRDAEDLTQETFARAFGSLHRFAGRSSARTWLLSIARRVCADAIRTRRPSIPVAELEPSGRGADPADTVSLRLLLDSLDPPFREAFVVTQVLGLSYAEAAEVIGCPIGTIRSRVARARDALVAGMGEGGSRTARGAS
jgi:RNA polymerase sigma-70 factor (ECF subfamily)